MLKADYMQVEGLEPLALTIVRESVLQGGYYAIQTDGDYELEMTNDLSLICNLSNEDTYVGINGMCECHIILFDSDKKDRGWIHWVNGNDGVERVSDYAIRLKDWISIDTVLFNWDCDYHRL